MKNQLTIVIGLHLGLASVLAQPVIPPNEPADQVVIAGSSATFSVDATGTPPLTYQWRQYTSATAYGDISGASNATLLLTNVQTNNLRFGVVVCDSTGSRTSRLAHLTVRFPPSFFNTNQPASQVGEVGDTITFTATAAGTTPLNYQWRWNDTNLPGKTATDLVLANVKFTDAGDYSVVVTNAYGAITSRVATLTVLPAAFTKITAGSIVNDGGFSFGCAWGDYNNDQFVDLFVCNFPPDAGVQHDFLYVNNGNGTFTRTTNGPLVNAGRWATGAAWGDYDNDGNLDIFVTRPGIANGLAPNTLYRNEGNGTFALITTGLVVTEAMNSHAGVWADVDNDGLLDLFVVNFYALPPTPAKDNYLYRNKGDGSFDRDSFGPKSPTNGDSWNVAAADFNNDGWIDLFVPQGGTQSQQNTWGGPRNPQNSLLYVNNQDGRFTLNTNSATFTQTANSVACAWGDYDNDGRLDLFVANFYGQNNFLYHNSDDGTFTLVTNSIAASDGGTSVGSAWGDYDNDGWLDLFVANLGPVDPTSGVSIVPESNFLYHNNGDGTFTRVTTGTPANDLGYSTGCAWADYDNDGFLDLFVANGWVTRSESNFLYHNNGNSNNWITLKLVGTASNRSAIGAKVRVKATIHGRTFWQLREISGGSNYGSQNDLRAIFGLGDATNVDLIRVEWPSSTVQTISNVVPKQFLTITEPPRLLAIKTNGTSHITLRGGRGFNYQIETSTNLPDWLPFGLLTISNQDGTASIHDTNASANRRFYRAVAP